MQHILIEEHYSRYKQQLAQPEGGPAHVYMGEYLAALAAAQLGESATVHVVWECPQGLESCTAVKDDAGRLAVTAVAERPNFLREDPLALRCLADEPSAAWQNLCHHQDAQGDIRYDPYYDRLPAFAQPGEDGAATMEQLRHHMEKLLSAACSYGEGDTVVLAGAPGRSNLLHDMLRRTFGVKTISLPAADKEDSSWQRNYDILAAKSALRLYMCGAPDYSQATLIIPTACGHDYAVMLPCDATKSTAEVFPGVTVGDLFREGDDRPDMQVAGAGMKSLSLRVDADMMGNQWLTACRADGTSARFLALADIAETGTAAAIFSTKTKTEKPL